MDTPSIYLSRSKLQNTLDTLDVNYLFGSLSAHMNVRPQTSQHNELANANGIGGSFDGTERICNCHMHRHSI